MKVTESQLSTDLKNQSQVTLEETRPFYSPPKVCVSTLTFVINGDGGSVQETTFPANTNTMPGPQ